LTGEAADDPATWPRKEFFYWNDDGQLVALRYDRWKLVFMEQRSSKFGVWMEPFVELRIPLVFDLRMDPFERAQHNANSYYEWMEAMIQWAGAPGKDIAGKMIMSFMEFPPRQKPSSFNLDDVLRKMSAGGEGK
jgi:arylsulfatase